MDNKCCTHPGLRLIIISKVNRSKWSSHPIVRRKLSLSYYISLPQFSSSPPVSATATAILNMGPLERAALFFPDDSDGDILNDNLTTTTHNPTPAFNFYARQHHILNSLSNSGGVPRRRTNVETTTASSTAAPPLLWPRASLVTSHRPTTSSSAAGASLSSTKTIAPFSPVGSSRTATVTRKVAASMEFTTAATAVATSSGEDDDSTLSVVREDFSSSSTVSDGNSVGVVTDAAVQAGLTSSTTQPAWYDNVLPTVDAGPSELVDVAIRRNRIPRM